MDSDVSLPPVPLCRRPGSTGTHIPTIHLFHSPYVLVKINDHLWLFQLLQQKTSGVKKKKDSLDPLLQGNGPLPPSVVFSETGPARHGPTHVDSPGQKDRYFGPSSSSRETSEKVVPLRLR